MTPTERPPAISRTRRWWSIPTAFLTVALMLFGAMTAPATAAPADATVYGSVSDADWSSLSGATVDLFGEDPSANSSAEPIASTTTSGGEFQTQVPADDEDGTYIWVRVAKSGYETQVSDAFEVWGDQSNYLGSYQLNVDESTFGTLSGSVADAAGSPLGNGRGYVEIFEDGAPDADYWDYYVRTVYTNNAGTWTAQLPEGQYRLRVGDDWGNLRSAWAGTGAHSYATAAVYTVTTQTTTTVPQVRLSEGAKITGKVTDTKGAPIKGVSVATYEGDNLTEVTSTNVRGEYTFTGLDAGSYRFQFSDYIGDYASKWYANGTSFATAAEVTLTDNQVRTGINVTLADSTDAPPVYNVTGKVIDRTGKGQRGAYVAAYRKNGSNWSWEDSAPVRKDGSVGFSDLPAGQYAFLADDDGNSADDPGFETQWFGGAFSRDGARVVTVGATGAVSLGTLTVTRRGTISGTLTVPALAGFSSLDRWAEIFNADGDRVESADLSSTGAFTATVVPGTYTVRFGATRYGDEDGYAAYVPQWWKGAYSPTTATKITVTEGGAVKGINATLGRNLAPVVAPRISGSAITGKTLTVSPGTWNRQSSTQYAYQWKVGGVNAGTGTAYKVKTADRGKAITASVTARDRYGDFVAGAATAKAVTAKEVAKVAVSAKAAKGKGKAARKATVTVALTLPGTAKSRVTGKVRIYDGSKLVGTVNVKKGKASKVVKLKKGKHGLKAVYAGSVQYTSATATRNVKVK